MVGITTAADLPVRWPPTPTRLSSQLIQIEVLPHTSGPSSIPGFLCALGSASGRRRRDFFSASLPVISTNSRGDAMVLAASSIWRRSFGRIRTTTTAIAATTTAKTTISIVDCHGHGRRPDTASSSAAGGFGLTSSPAIALPADSAPHTVRPRPITPTSARTLNSSVRLVLVLCLRACAMVGSVRSSDGGAHVWCSLRSGGRGQPGTTLYETSRHPESVCSRSALIV